MAKRRIYQVGEDVLRQVKKHSHTLPLSVYRSVRKQYSVQMVYLVTKARRLEPRPVTAAYGQILTQAVLDAFPLGVVNVHASLLPKYRGASPIQSAIAAGELETGVTRAPARRRVF